ncbi:RHS repeat domain-containing protein [Streptomyces diacarni]|uniref:RHS repeat protein n=1 Tax=Streptomyces diacarni TaxID=2800381 RepID=A0A367EGK5_9ACTN|nr:hypothetical protein DTL70_29175 [Streptomyces diacarni]
MVRFGHDPRGNLAEVTGSTGDAWRFGYDEAARIVS